MADIDLKTETPDASLPADGFLFGADSQAAASPSVYTTQSVATRLLGSTTLSGTTITADAPVLDLAQTWNNAAVSFTAMKLNVTNTASLAASYLFDYQFGSTTRLRLTTAGVLTLGTAAGLGDGSAGTLSILNGTTTVANFGNANLVLLSRGISFGVSIGSQDLFLGRRAAANLRLGAADAAAPVAQTLSVQGVVAGTTNTAGANLTIAGSQGTGTGAGGSIVFQVAPAGSSGTAQNALADALTINANRSLSVATTMTIGDNSGTVGRLNIGVALSQGLFFGNRGSIGTQADGVIVMRDNATTSFGRLCFGGATSSFPALKRTGATLETRLADDSGFAPHAAEWFSITDGVTAPGASAGRARLYVDVADGDLKVVFADGTVKTIVTDT